jgi:DNA-binding transcriptional LysR family regulator
MPRENLNDLQAFVHVAREGSFTKAAAQLGVSQSALSHAMRGLEQRLACLLTRTTRSVSTTEAGARLLDTSGPRLAARSRTGWPHWPSAGTPGRHHPHQRHRPCRRVHRLAAAGAVVAAYPDLKVELAADYGLADIVAERYDIGIRLGERLARDMVAVPISRRCACAWSVHPATSASTCRGIRTTWPTTTA